MCPDISPCAEKGCHGLALAANSAFSLDIESGRVSNFQGRYSFALSEAVARGELRPLRDLDALDQ